MSTGIEENPTHIDRVDVDEVGQDENVFPSDITCDSGVDSVDSCSTTLPASNSEVSPLKLPENDVKIGKISAAVNPLEDDSSSLLSSPTSISPDNKDATDNLDECASHKTELLTFENQLKAEDNMDLDKLLLEIGIPTHEQSNNASTVDCTDNHQNYEQIVPRDLTILNEYSKSQLELDCEINRILATSTVSLNDHKMSSDNNNISICKSPYSRSADNISTIDQNLELENNFNSSNKELNTEKIISQFTSNKNKASATQKMLPEIPHKNIPENSSISVKYTNLPKELLSQDLGSIVKNVHGIFSSVSGSLINVYTHRNNPKPARTTVKPLPNGKIMNDIFEDENNVDNANVICTNVADKPCISHEMINEEIQYARKTSDTDGVDQEDDAKKDILRLQIESLERMLSEQRKENASLRDRVKQQVDEMQAKDQTFKDLEGKLDQMSKRAEHAEREKDAAVMRYAGAECAAIECRRAAARAAAGERAARAELELAAGKLKSAHGEKARICQLYDDKCHELQDREREVSRSREEARELEGRLKWTQSKLRMEMDAYKESAERAEKLSQQVGALEAARDAAAASAGDSARSRQLESELKESQAALILCRHELEVLERRWAGVAGQLDTCRRERDEASGALARATAEVEQLKISNMRLEEEAAELAALRAQAALADTLSAQLHRESERASQAEEALSRERARAETCARREAGALEHAARLTAQHVAQRARTADHEAKTQALSLDNSSLRERVSRLEGECSRLEEALVEEEERRHKENRVLARKVAELTEEVSQANEKLEWEQGENSVMKKKHASAMKEVNREMQRALRRCEQLEARLPPQDTTSARTGSVSSLSSAESAPQEERPPPPPPAQNGHADPLPDIQVLEPDRQALIERIVSLQRAAARRAERCDFLEEHARQLTGELRARARLLRRLLCALPAGAVASPASDAHKKEIAQLGGGAMAAVWGGDPDGMTLELSLEMNKRLQAVLEDALLKNITLKENMDTLGEEIARLKKQNNSTPEPK